MVGTSDPAFRSAMQSLTECVCYDFLGADLYVEGVATSWLPRGDLLICNTEIFLDPPVERPGFISIQTLDFSTSADAVHAVDGKYDANARRPHRQLRVNEFAAATRMVYCPRFNVGILAINKTIRIVAPDLENRKTIPC